jgi:chromosomal replication initiator protein
VFVAAPEGLGKTHLAKAVASTASGRAGIRAVYVSAESFTNQFTSSLRARRTEEFKRRYRETCDLLVVEDLDFVAGKAQTQLELFHTIEHLLETGRRVFLTSSRLPREIEGLDARLQSRLTSGLVAEIDPPDAALRRAILLAKAASGGFRLPADCADRLVEAAPNSVRDLVGVLTQLVSMAALLKRPIDRELTEAALRKVTPASAPRRSLSPSDVVEAVCSSLGTTPAVLGSRTRRRDVLAPRQVAMYLCRRFTDASLSEIGALFGRDHPAVANAVAVVERGLLERAPLRYQVEALSQKLDMLARGAGAGAVRSGVSSQRP